MPIRPEDFDKPGPSEPETILPSGSSINQFGEFVRGKDVPKKDVPERKDGDFKVQGKKDLLDHLL